MLRRGRAGITAIVLFVGTSVAANAFADLLASATAMACCAKTEYECAGVSTPDDCCQHMGHTAVQSVADIVAKAPPPGLAMIAVAPAFGVQIAAARLEPHSESAVALLVPASAPAELRHIEIKTLGMD